MSADGKAIVQEWCARWAKGYDELCQAFRDQLAGDSEYQVHPDMPLMIGPEQAVAAMGGFRAGFDLESITVEFLKIAQVGNDVWSERIDTCVNTKGEGFIAIPIAGVMTLDDDGKVVRWHDYWDFRELEKLAPAG